MRIIPKEIKLITQKESNDCGIACVAMLLGRSYNYIKRKLPLDNKEGISVESVAQFVSTYGLWMRDYSNSENLFYGRVYLATIMIENKFHFILSDTRNNKLINYDPAKEKISDDLLYPIYIHYFVNTKKSKFKPVYE